ncbi:MAG: GTPase HflX [candidate division WOR-3 bacterium]|nr:MAG: GTPase HflX [candidate division WOR-3 bacterium]
MNGPGTDRSNVLLVGLARDSRARWAKADSLEELAFLTDTAGGNVVERLIQVREKPDPATLVGKGMVERLRQLCREHQVELVIFDEELSPTQQRNIEEGAGVRIIDRAALILDIFALHARSAEAKIQVELAQLDYRQSRLTGFGVEMSRLGGGIGTRGPGETQLEVDRRRIKQRIAALRKALGRIDRERATQRRRRAGLFRAVLVGYTNAGKSTLFNRLTAAAVKVSDQLFATLDPNTKVLDLDRHVRVALTDTVGFIRSLPHQLVASFRATLSEVREADLLLHVIDASDAHVDRHVDVVNDTIEEVGGKGRPVLMVFSKKDRVFDDAALDRLDRNYVQAVFVSGTSGEGIDQLKEAMLAMVEKQMVTRQFTLPASRTDLISLVCRAGRVLSDRTQEDRRRILVKGSRAALGRARKLVDEELGVRRAGS